MFHCNIAVEAIQFATIEGVSRFSFDRNAVLMGLFDASISDVRLPKEDVGGLLHDWHVIELKVSLPSTDLP